MSAVSQTHFETLTLLKRGKVRDVYVVDGYFLLVATDRVSAFDVVMKSPIPGKGEILTALSAFWFQKLTGQMPHHFVSCNVADFPSQCLPYQEVLRGRSMLVRQAEPIPVECVVRGYLVGSAWQEYQQRGTVGELPLPSGMQYGDPLPQPFFTPALKVETGHDQNVSFDVIKQRYGTVAVQLRRWSLALYQYAAEYLASRGLILVDTKFEFGWAPDGQLLVIDEIFTPDSSRFWRVEDYQQHQRDQFFDKQILRDYLAQLDRWDRQTPLMLPAEIVQKMALRYQQLFEMVTGIPWTAQRVCR